MVFIYRNSLVLIYEPEFWYHTGKFTEDIHEGIHEKCLWTFNKKKTAPSETNNKIASQYKMGKSILLLKKFNHKK